MKSERNERFAHLRDSHGNLKVTIAYTKPDENDCVLYAIAVVSPSEPANKISKNVARNKLRARLSTAKVPDSPKGISRWRAYKDKPISSHNTPHGKDSPYSAILQVGLAKIGYIKSVELKLKVDLIRGMILKV